MMYSISFTFRKKWPFFVGKLSKGRDYAFTYIYRKGNEANEILSGKMLDHVSTIGVKND